MFTMSRIALERAAQDLIPKPFGMFADRWSQQRLTAVRVIAKPPMFILEALHPDGWYPQGSAKVEYWALQEAQILCCGDGRHYRILEADSGRIVALVDPSSCRIAPRQEASPTALQTPCEAAQPLSEARGT